MRGAAIFVSMLVLTTPSESSKSCMTKIEARQHFGSMRIYWYAEDHCWDATPTRRRHQIHKVQQRIGQPKWYEAISEMLPDEEPVQIPWVDRWADIEPPQLPIVARSVDIAQVAPPPIIEREPEPITPRGVVMVIITIVPTLVIVVLFGGLINERPTSRRNTRSSGHDHQRAEALGG